MSPQKKKYLVLGLGASGQSASRLLLSEGADVVAMDRAENKELCQQCEELVKRGARLLWGDREIPDEKFDVCVISPGISLNSAWAKNVTQRGIEIISELELGWSRAKCRVVAVSGTNGKSTAVKWMVESFQAAGFHAKPSGNYGIPVSKIVLEEKTLDWLVVEVSSFQLEAIKDFRPDVALLLNILPNHLDRHQSMDVYERMKANLFRNMQKNEPRIVHESCYGKMKKLAGSDGLWITFGTSENAEYFFHSGKIMSRKGIVADLKDSFFDNDVLGGNAAGVIAALTACGVAAKHAEKTARRFVALPHRMERVADISGVVFVDDSKATTLSATAAALQMCKGKVRLIAGGLLKENDFNFIKEILEQKAAAVYLIGQASETMNVAWSDRVSCRDCKTLNAALAEAWRDAASGETILLSPGCASFDQFRNYEDRGEQFKQLVKKLVEEKETWLTR